MDVIELVCLMEEELLISFFDIQVHVLIHFADEIEFAWCNEHPLDILGREIMCILKRFVHQIAYVGVNGNENWLHKSACVASLCIYQM